MRGLMVDAGRVPETMDYYKRVIEFCAEWELNTLQFRLTDDQGSAMRFTSVPDLVNHANAFTPEQLKSLVEFAQSHGVDLIPEPMHTCWIKMHPDPRSLRASFLSIRSHCSYSRSYIVKWPRSFLRPIFTAAVMK
jgi:hypothetical protein